MRKVIAAFNMTLNGICDHTAGIADEDLHKHYAELIDHGAVILYGRKTYELMLFWQELLNKPSGEQSMDNFAIAIDKIPKLIFSNNLKNSGWDSAKIALKPIAEEISTLKQYVTKDILVGSRSLIIQLLNSNLIDELQICIHPVIEGKGLLLFDQIEHSIMLKLTKTKLLSSGAAVFYYEPIH
jgi:dihydrofolate reductase